MRRVVNGVETDLHTGGATVHPLSDRLWVKGDGAAASAAVVKQGDVTWVSYQGRVFRVERPTVARSHASHSDGDLRAPMPGLVVDVLVVEGQAVEKGDKIVVLEAMKTQQTFVAPFDGTVVSVSVASRQQVDEGVSLAVVEEA